MSQGKDSPDFRQGDRKTQEDWFQQHCPPGGICLYSKQERLASAHACCPSRLQYCFAPCQDGNGLTHCLQGAPNADKICSRVAYWCCAACGVIRAAVWAMPLQLFNCTGQGMDLTNVVRSLARIALTSMNKFARCFTGKNPATERLSCV